MVESEWERDPVRASAHVAACKGVRVSSPVTACESARAGANGTCSRQRGDSSSVRLVKVRGPKVRCVCVQKKKGQLRAHPKFTGAHLMKSATGRTRGIAQSYKNDMRVKGGMMKHKSYMRWNHLEPFRKALHFSHEFFIGWWEPFFPARKPSERERQYKPWLQLDALIKRLKLVAGELGLRGRNDGFTMTVWTQPVPFISLSFPTEFLRVYFELRRSDLQRIIQSAKIKSLAFDSRRMDEICCIYA